MQTLKNIDLVIPVLNPNHGWAEATLSKKKSFEKALECQVRLIISDDGSKSKTEFDLLHQLDPTSLIVRSESNRGKGHSLRLGISKSDADFLLFTDADFPYEIESMVSIARSLESGADVCLGYREEDYYASVPWFRKGLSESFRFVLKTILKFPITDTQCGLKGMGKKGKSIFMETRIDRFLVDMEFIKLAVNQNANIKPVVVSLRPNVQFSSMGASVLIREFINFLRILLI